MIAYLIVKIIFVTRSSLYVVESGKEKITFFPQPCFIEFVKNLLSA